MKLMIVDDSIFTQKYIKKVITTRFPTLEIIIADSGEHALELYKDDKIDFIITDLLMPGMGGQELIRIIRETDNEINIVVHSSDIQKVVKEEIMQFNVLSFINKPMNLEKEESFIRIIEECLNA